MAVHWLDLILRSPALGKLAQRLEKSARLPVRGNSGSSTNLLGALLALKLQRPILLVVPHLDDADDALDDLASVKARHPELELSRFPALELTQGESAVAVELLAERLAVVEALAGSKASRPAVLAAPVQALMQTVPKPQNLKDYTLTLKPGLTLSPAKLLDWLDRAGYVRTEAIELPGDFSVRGGIIDIYAPACLVGQTPSAEPLPVRLDYFGDEIDSLHLINTETLGSGKSLDSLQLVGASLKRLQSDDESTSLVSLLPREYLMVLQEPLELAEQARGYYERLTNPRGICSPASVLQSLTHRPCVEVTQFRPAAAGDNDVVTLPVRPLEPVASDTSQAIRELAEASSTRQIVVLCQKEAEQHRLGELLEQADAAAAKRISLEVGYLHRGFNWEIAGSDTSQGSSDAAPGSGSLMLLPHHELFHRYHVRRKIRRISTGAGLRASDAFLDLDVGDPVVHTDHGIAIYRGLKTLTRKGKSEDFLALEFAEGATLHVPATQIELVQKYVGGFQGRPPLSLLGGKRWQKQKQQAQQAVKDLAVQLLQVQAARSSLPGIRYPEDTLWQQEFEAEFPYEETEDQLAALAEIKKDMSHDQPMDRLICGDVGFGKTELAIRAAFKAAEFGKQVAVLVPTTVLAEQHERTFRDRMAAYPFRIASLSRFKSGAEQVRILEDVARGQVDIVIGTHRLLSADVLFRDLGLVIIDEEQRFGVEHKNKLLQFRLTADVLTLSATPIPRTLHMSMLGLRDISSLSTAPLDRRAVVTEVIDDDSNRIKHAIERELARDGQVYFVHNRVHDIHSVAARIKSLAPKARIVVGHGQMAPSELEPVMLRFMRHEADILISTTIIESGIDIPAANTMFIDDADNFGLADLHQLRGRVGRYKHRAYCYLILPGDRPITEKAQRRLKAIEQYSMLGAGFKIAMRDLEIRGAGNLLGAEQSGHIAAVGYQMYCQLLDREAQRLRHEKIVEPMLTHLELPVSARLPGSYIASDRSRMEMYRRLSRATSLKELDEVVRDMVDAHGKPPDAAQALLDLTELRLGASLLGIESLKLEPPDIIIRTHHPLELDAILRSAPGRATLVDDHTVYYRPPENYLTPAATLLAVLRKLLVTPVRLREAGKVSSVATPAGREK